jgi:hypothetical protein
VVPSARAHPAARLATVPSPVRRPRSARRLPTRNGKAHPCDHPAGWAWADPPRAGSPLTKSHHLEKMGRGVRCMTWAGHMVGAAPCGRPQTTARPPAVTQASTCESLPIMKRTPHVEKYTCIRIRTAAGLPPGTHRLRDGRRRPCGAPHQPGKSGNSSGSRITILEPTPASSSGVFGAATERRSS